MNRTLNENLPSIFLFFLMGSRKLGKPVLNAFISFLPDVLSNRVYEVANRTCKR